MLDGIEEHGVRVALVEDAFARSLMAQELGVLPMRRGVEVICASSDNLTATNEASRVEMRRLADAFRIRGGAAGAGAARRPRRAGHGAKRCWARREAMRRRSSSPQIAGRSGLGRSPDSRARRHARCRARCLFISNIVTLSLPNTLAGEHPCYTRERIDRRRAAWEGEG